MENGIESILEIRLLIAVAVIVFPLVQAALAEVNSVLSRAAEYHVRKTGENIRPVASHIRRAEILIANGRFAEDGQYRDWILAGKRALRWRRWAIILMILAIAFVLVLVLRPSALGDFRTSIAVSLVILACLTYVAVIFRAGQLAGQKVDLPE